MRRGRPTKPTSHQNSAKPSPSPLRVVSSDPFAVLDGGKARQGASDELSSRFPTLDEFSLLHEKGGKFEFEPTVTELKPTTEDLSKRITNALADEAFVKPQIVPQKSPTLEARVINLVDMPAADIQLKSSPDPRVEHARQQTQLHQPVPQKPVMVSTGTMTSPSPPLHNSDSPPFSTRPIYKFPPSSHERRPSSQPWDSDTDKMHVICEPSQSRTILFKREPKQKSSSENMPKSPASSRPSLEGPRPSTLDLSHSLTRSKSANAKSRPSSALAASEMDYLHDLDGPWSFDTSLPHGHDEVGPLLHPSRTDVDRDYDRASISSDIEFLRAKEEETNRKREKRLSSGSKHVKRSSLSSISLSGTKTLFTSRFGDAFRRFEHNAGQERKSRSPSPDGVNARLTPITGSEATEMSDDGHVSNDLDDISPEVRRELERRRLSQEEKRVAAAAAEYRLRMAERGEGGQRGGMAGEGTRSTVIQNKVQALLRENNKPPSIKTASGYGRFTDPEAALQAKQFEALISERPRAPTILRKPVSSERHGFDPKPLSNDMRAPGGPGQVRQQQSSSTPFTPRLNQRPPAPPKPNNLRTGSRIESPIPSNDELDSSRHNRTVSVTEDWEANFSKRYPSLSGIEMVETEIDLPKLPVLRTKEV